MGVIELEEAIRKLPEKERHELFLKFVEDIEDIIDIYEMKQAIKEGGSVPYDEFRKTLFND